MTVFRSGLRLWSSRRRRSSPFCSPGCSWASGRAAPRSSAPPSAWLEWVSLPRGASGGASLGPFLLVIIAALFWGAGNVLAKSFGKVDMLAVTVWSSLAAPPPLFALSLAVEGKDGLAALAHPNWKLIVSVLVISYAGTVFGFGVWARLLAHHSAASVAPFSLLVPVVGIIAGSILFGETLEPVELLGGGLAMAGLALNIFGDWALRRAIAKKSTLEQGSFGRRPREL
jgi:drug/metabolite transporter (DMT)-like permease